VFHASNSKVKIKKITVEFGDAKFDLKVRIPLKAEMEQIMAKISNPDQAKVEQSFKKYADPIKDAVAKGGGEFLEQLNKDKEYIKITDDDVIMDGNSVKQVATLNVMWQTKVEEYFHLLQSELDEPITENFEEISAEFPDEAIKKIVEDIEQAIKPDYVSVKKN